MERHQASALRTAMVVLRDATDSEDAVQEAFVRAFARLEDLREDGAFRGWLLRIVANESLNRARSSSRHRAATERAVAAETRRSHPSAEASVIESEERRLLFEAVDRLSDQDRLVIGCRRSRWTLACRIRRREGPTTEI